MRTSTEQSPPAAPTVRIGLNAVIATVDADAPKVLCVKSEASSDRNGDGLNGRVSLPFGPFDPERHRTFETGLRDWVERQTSVELGYIEQLYTFGDKGREAPTALLDDADQSVRVVSVGYLALTPSAAAQPFKTGATPHTPQWRSWYDFFPWEDWRAREPSTLSETILPALGDWIARAPDAAGENARRTRARLAFGFTELGWEEERALDRYELMYEAGLVEEAWRDRAAAGLSLPRADRAIAAAAGVSMASDHRRILATAIGRLRGKLKYRAVVFELTPPAFSLFDLQRDVEAIVGFCLHKQNFRRSVTASGLVEKTGDVREQGSGRPAALFQVSPKSAVDRAAKGLSIPRLRLSPSSTL